MKHFGFQMCWIVAECTIGALVGVTLIPSDYRYLWGFIIGMVNVYGVDIIREMPNH